MKNETRNKSQEAEPRSNFDQAFAEQLLGQVMADVKAAFGKDVVVESRREWQYIRDRYLFDGLLIDQQIALFYVRGHVQSVDAPFVFERMKQLIAAAGEKKLFYIMDLSGIQSFSLSARKAYAAIDDELKPHWLHSYYIFSTLGNTIFKLYASIKPAFAQQVTLTRSIAHAISLCKEKALEDDTKESVVAEPDKLSREELLREYQLLKNKYIRLEKKHKRRADELISIMSRITWEQDFSPSAPTVKENDPFFNVFSSLSLLKEDLQEILDQHKRAQQNLEEEVARQTWRFSSVIENTSEMIMSVDRHWKVQVINAAFQEHFLSFQQKSIQVGDHLLEQYDEENKRYWKQRFDRAFEGTGFYEIITSEAEGQKVCFEIVYNPIRHPGEDKVSEVSVFARDISMLRRTEDTARENEKNLIRALKIARAGSWEFDLLNGKMVIGKEGLQVIGYPDHHELQLSIDEFVSNFLYPDDVPLVKERMAYALQHIDNPDFQDQFAYRLFHKNGHVLHLMLYSRFKSGKRGVIYGITQDISAQKEAQDQLLLQNDELRKVNSELDRFVYSVSHDLRAPLASVLGLINIARNETDIKQQLHYLDLQEKSIHKLDNFIREIIDLSKNSRLEISREEIDFQQLVNDLYDAQYYDAAASEVHKLFRIEQRAPFYSDYRRLYVAMNNLVSNSLRYANLRQEEPFVRIDIQVDHSQAVISVEDNGLGIAAEQMPHIFKMFYRANEHKTGSGLGLYIVQETLDKLGGEISVSSTLGKGTIFTVKIPSEVPCHSLSSI
ncbi:MAG: PAS domain-containing sensor histidine kinase [Cyclobacteriaceae bacterium]